MPIKRALTGILLIVVSTFSYGQIIGFDAIEDSLVSPWIPEDPKEYEYVYHFGASEMESYLVLFHGKDKYYGQIKAFEYDEELQTWYSTYTNLNNVRIEGYKFYSDQTNGEFIVYDNGEEKIKGLKIFDSWTGSMIGDEYEIGTRDYNIDKYFEGKYPQASKRVLSKLELLKLDKAELKIMRNEIFARYGYQFRGRGEMDKYFSSQNWYRKEHVNVNAFLTELEKKNIELIRSVESK